MANKIRPEEDDAADVIASHLGVTRPVNTDVNGEADLAFVTAAGRRAAVEVTTLTDQDAHRNDAARQRETARPYRPSTLAKTWNVTVAEERVRHRGLRERLEPLLAELEAAAVGRVRRHEYYKPELSQKVRDVIRALAADAVEEASVMPTPSDRAVEPAIFISTFGGYSSSGSAAALEEIESYIAENEDNLNKLGAAQVSERHLFLWLDFQTPGEIAMPFTTAQARQWDHFGLPQRPPDLPEPVTHLWVVHRGTGRGWMFDPAVGWQELGPHSAA